jgi:hypothetical protein
MHCWDRRTVGGHDVPPKKDENLKKPTNCLKKPQEMYIFFVNLVKNYKVCF